jgi:hypothetical protein
VINEQRAAGREGNGVLVLVLTLVGVTVLAWACTLAWVLLRLADAMADRLF